MPLARHYRLAPITEALIDLRVTYDGDPSLVRLRRFTDSVKDDYPVVAPREMMQAEFNVQPNAISPPSVTSRSTVGFICHTKDRRQAVQARLDGFTFSRFAPYERWETLKDEANRLWRLFTERTGALTVSRLALRYINQINLPAAGNDDLNFEHYLRTAPTIGPDAGQFLDQFFMRLVLPQSDLAAQLILTEALLPRQNEAVVGVLLDIDLFREALTLPTTSVEIWNVLEQFRERKNQYFEASITDETRRLFE